MIHEPVRSSGEQETSGLVRAAVTADGTGSHAYAVHLAAPHRMPAPNRTAGAAMGDLADAAHYLCLLHGRHPGVIDHAATRIADNAARDWLLQAADAFVVERAFLTRVTVAVGPLPSTHGQNECEAAVTHQRHALEMLAQSDRRGCAMGAAIALVLDWAAIRRILDAAALRAGIEPKPSMLPDIVHTLDVADAISDGDAAARAIHFGARQLLSQQRGLWDLLSARAEMRAKN